MEKHIFNIKCFVWLIGALFSWGFEVGLANQTSLLDAVWQLCIALVCWPLQLGVNIAGLVR